MTAQFLSPRPLLADCETAAAQGSVWYPARWAAAIASTTASTDPAATRRDLPQGAARRADFVRNLARPEGVGRALATYEIPIEGRDEWLAAARRLA
jgi:hypothetical protein